MRTLHGITDPPEIQPLNGPLSDFPSAFDGYEVSPVAEFSDHHDGTYCEVVVSRTHYDEVKDEAIGFMFTVYGHFETGGVHAFADVNITPEFTWEEARRYALRLAATIDGGHTKFGVSDFTFDEP